MNSYPNEILPKTYFSKKLNIDKIFDFSEQFFVCRVVYESPQAHISEDFDGNKILDIDLFKEHIVHMSVNLMGGLYKCDHIKYRTASKHKSSDDWHGEKINLNDFFDGYEIKEPAFPIFFSSSDIHRQILPYSYINPDKNRKKTILNTFHDKCVEIFDDHTNVECELFIEHHPTNLNYWHMQIEMKPRFEDDSNSFKNDKTFKKDLYTQFVSDVLTRKFILDLPKTAYISPCAYCGIPLNCNKPTKAKCQ